MDVGVGAEIYRCMLSQLGEKKPVFYLIAVEKNLGGGLGTRLVVGMPYSGSVMEMKCQWSWRSWPLWVWRKLHRCFTWVSQLYRLMHPAEYVNHLSWTEGADSIVFCSQFTLHAKIAFYTFTTHEIIMANKWHCLYYNIQKQVHKCIHQTTVAR